MKEAQVLHLLQLQSIELLHVGNKHNQLRDSPLRNCLIFHAYGSTDHIKYNKNTYTNTPKRLNYKRTKKQRVMKNFLQHFLFLFVFVSSTISINHLYMISVLASKYQLMCCIHGCKY